MDNPPIKLSVQNLTLRFGGITALDDVSFDVRQGEILALIGPNGAGKTSCINSIGGFYRPQSGRVYLDGRDITRLPPYQRAKLGLSRTFQNIALYTNATTLDNLMAARHIHMRSSLIGEAIFWGMAQREEIKHRRVVEEIIDFLEMQAIRKSVVGKLGYGL
ncbi:MAG: ABC transporter ATP-binding protein, partial [Aggregatilineales bacterium]